MRRRIIASFLLAGLLTVEARAETGLALSDAVLHGALPLADLRAGLDPVTDKACLERYLAGIPSRSPLWQTPPPASAETALLALRRRLVEQIIALLGEPVRGEAFVFVHELPLTVEWEGMMENPLAEAEFVANRLAAHPASPLAPFLHLLHAHRLGAAWQYAPDRAKAALASRFDIALAPALASGHPTLACLARDLQAHHRRAR